jgi:hypothetical protein
MLGVRIGIALGKRVSRHAVHSSLVDPHLLTDADQLVGIQPRHIASSRRQLTVLGLHACRRASTGIARSPHHQPQLITQIIHPDHTPFPSAPWMHVIACPCPCMCVPASHISLHRWTLSPSLSLSVSLCAFLCDSPAIAPEYVKVPSLPLCGRPSTDAPRTSGMVLGGGGGVRVRTHRGTSRRQACCRLDSLSGEKLTAQSRLPSRRRD